MSIIIGIIVGGVLLYMLGVARSFAAGLFAISNSINVLAESIKDASQRTEDQLQEIHRELYSLHTVLGGREGHSDQEFFEQLNGRTIHHILGSIDRHLEAMIPESSKPSAGSVRLVR